MFPELVIDSEYVYAYASERKQGRVPTHDTVTFRVIGKTVWFYMIRFVGPRPAWMDNDIVLFGTSMHLMSIPVR